MKEVAWDKFNTAHKDRLTTLSNGSLLLYALPTLAWHKLKIL